MFEMLGEYPVQHFLCARDKIVSSVLLDESVGVIVDVVDVLEGVVVWGFGGSMLFLSRSCQMV